MTSEFQVTACRMARGPAWRSRSKFLSLIPVLCLLRPASCWIGLHIGHMEDIRIPIYAAEPYEEASPTSQGRDDLSVASPDALAAFYQDMERKEIVERKLSKRKSNSGTSIWSRKSVKRSATAHPAPPPAQKPHLPNPDSDHQDEKRRGEEERENESREDTSDKPDWVPQMNSPRSIIPDSKELPAWYNKDAWSQVPLPSFKLRYVIHNPIGPRWYKNHHLIPPSETTPAARPPSFFSPSFPPMASSTSQDRSEDTTRLPGPSHTPSPLPTPNSSQTRVVDKPRSRKTSQTAHDNVDLLDVTDPWGTNWHHHSPYDVGLSNGPISVDVQDALHTRSRRSSMTAQSRRKTVPSPLSQSTSAIHLQSPPDAGVHIPRKLSKRRTPTVANIFGGQSQDASRNAVSLPTSPVEAQPLATDLPKRMSVAPPNGPSMFASQGSSPKKEKRGSVLGRLVKKFSLLKKSTRRDNDWQHVISDHAVVDNAPRRDFVPERQPSPEKLPFDAVKRVPPPAIDEAAMAPDDTTKEADRLSYISLEAPFSIGRLTVANPDVPGSGETTPAQGDFPLPPDKFELRDTRVSSELPYRSPSPSTSSPFVSPPDPNPPVLPEKTTPPPPPPAKERAPELSPLSPPSSIRPPSFDLQRPPAQKTSISSVRAAPSIMSRTSRISVKDTQSAGPYAEKSTISSHRSGSSSKAPQMVEPVSRVFEMPQSGPPPPKKTRPVSVASSIPFPGAETGERVQSFALYDNSPLSAASMLANPPTPYSNDISMLATPEHPLPGLPPRLSADITSGAQMTRQTETFRLVRSPSGNVYPSNETFVAGGQQWEVVEATDKGKGKVSSSSKDRHSRDRDLKLQDTKDRNHHKERDSKDRESKDRPSKDRESNGRREKKRESRTKAEPEPEADSRHQHRSHRDHKSRTGEHATSTSKKTLRSADSDLRRRETSAAAVQQDVVKGGRDNRRRDDQERNSERKKEVSPPVNLNKAQPAPPAPTPDTLPSRPLGRHPSLSARPTSQLFSADEMNSIKAKEAWDMERLWKARSMQGDELNRFTTIPSNHNTPLIGSISDTSSQSAIYGSSHTAFVVQTPFQSQHSIYHSMPAAPPPIIYSSPSSIPTIAHQLPPTHRQSHSRLYADSIASDQASYTSSSRTPNPLPDPPRESSYEIPAGSRNSEYWTKYAGVTASH
ncbi:hypothetical protein D9615_001350 [Tricholomella constricta]|uniref:Uncharacterized protein n=1 Tax=Tricholomella constricta TaxID=117010 RepID=A0A8H5M873_9AGAR|nr:hypothetical protein D9615_001350 [Tricholomella constricta]